MKKLLLTSFILFTVLLSTRAQTVKNVQARAENNKVYVTYDLVSAVEGQKFNIELRSSINNFTTVLQEVSGDVGLDQEPGIGKTIIWNAIKEQGNFTGSVTFEINSTLTYSPLAITNPTTGSSAKIGKPLDIQWQGGDRGKNLKMSILQGSSSITEIPNVGSTGRYMWEVPKSLAKGDNYQIKLFDPSKPNDAALSAKFQLKKTSILVYIIPGVVVAGAAAYFLFSGGDPPPGVDCATNPTHPDCGGGGGTDLPDPPPLPGG